MNIVASGQLASSEATLFAGSGVATISCYNTSNSTTETVSILVKSGTDASKTIAHVVLSPHEQVIVRGISLSVGGFLLRGQSTNATTVDYVISVADSGDFGVEVHDASGTIQQSFAEVSGSLLVPDNLTVTGTSTLTDAVSCGATLAVTGASTLTGNVACSGTLAVTSTTTLTGAATLTGGGTAIARFKPTLLAVGPAPTDTFASTITADVTKSLHVIAAASGTSATCTVTPSAAGSAGDLLVFRIATTSAGTVTFTFASTFVPNGTLAVQASKFATIAFVSDGSRWCELFRTTDLA